MRELNAFGPKLEGIADEFVELIRQRRDSTGVINNFKSLINLFGLEALAGFIFDTRLGLLDPKPTIEIVELATAVQQLFKVYRDVFYGSSLWKYVPNQTWRNYVKSEEIIYR